MGLNAVVGRKKNYCFLRNLCIYPQMLTCLKRAYPKELYYCYYDIAKQ